MRNQFYSDRKDIWKWSLLLELAGDTHHVYQVAMLTRDEGEHTLDEGDPWPCSNLVRAFFDRERRSKAHDIYRVEGLINGRITVLNRLGCEYQFYSNRSRDHYFTRVLETIKTDNGKRKLVFLDPDNGLEVKNSNQKHVRSQEICRVWNALNPGDYMVLYQHHSRDFKMRQDPARLRKYIDEKKAQIANATAQASELIKERTHDAVSFLWLERR